MKLTMVDIAIRRGVTEISGRNGSGKSSTMHAIEVLLDGMKVAPAEPINANCERTRIRGRIGEMYVIRHIQQDKHGKYTQKLQFQPIDGKAYPATQAQLHDLIGQHSLDPLDFLKLDSKGMFKAFQTFVPGFDFEQAATDHKTDYDRRTEVNRIAKESRAAAGLILVPALTPDEPIDEAALVKQLQDAGTENARTVQRRANREKVAADAAALRKSIEDAPRQLSEHNARIAEQTSATVEDLTSQILDLEAQIRRKRGQIEQANQNAEKLIADEAARVALLVSAAREEAEALEAQLAEAGPLPEVVDTALLTHRINQARTTNEAVKRKVERTKHITTAEKYERESKELTESIEAREAAKKKAIADANLPLQGLDLADGEIRLNGQPFSQASMAEKITLALAYTVKRNPDLRLAWMRDASLLDDDAYARVEKLAEEYDCDVLLETVRPIGKNVVILEDGRVKSVSAEAA
jgi:hypothetical protein